MPVTSYHLLRGRLTILSSLALVTLFIFYFWSNRILPSENKTSSTASPISFKSGKVIPTRQQENRSPKYTFILGGVQKSGTGALFYRLRRHPFLQVTVRKELHFFDHDKFNWKEPDYTAYESRPLHGSPSMAVGECTPSYIYWPHAIERIHDYNPRMKLIFIFRHPVDRAFSQWKMVCRQGVETESFSWAIREGRKRIEKRNSKSLLYLGSFSYVERGFYGQQLEKVLRFFPRKQLLLLLSDDFRYNSTAIIERISEFLGVPAPKERLMRPGRRVKSRKRSKEPVMNATDAEYLQTLYNDDLKLFAKLSGLNITSWFR